MIDNIELPDGAVVKYLPASTGSLVQSVVWEDSTYLGATE